MSDYLGTLVARTQRPMDALRPRPVSRFEPVGGRIPGGTLLEERNEEEPAAPAPHPSENRPSPGTPTARATRTAPPRPAAGLPLPRPTAGPPAARPAPASTALPAASEAAGPPESQARTTESSPFTPTPPSVEGTPITPLDVVLESPVARATSRSERQVAPLSPRDAAPAYPSEPAGGSVPLTVPPGDEYAPPALRPETRAYVAPPSPALPGPDAAAAEPVIRVTIGRVEVRATLVAPPPAPARPRNEPSLTLEAYRRKRTGERE